MPGKYTNTFFVTTLFVGALMFLSSCKVAKKLSEGETLLRRNKFILETKAKAAEKQQIQEDLATIASQKPNKRFLGLMPFRMWLYHSATHSKKLNKFRQWIIDKVGEAPVVYDSLLTQKSKANMEAYLFNFGYFDNTITDTVIHKNRRTTVIYKVTTNQVWKIADVELPKEHNSCDSLVRERRKNNYLKRGERFDITNLKAERERIDTILRNNGYYFFNREYITFDLDSNRDSKTVNIKIIINQPNDTIFHEQYRINNIYIVTDYFTEKLSDTLPRKTDTLREYYFQSHKMNFRKGVLTDAIFFGQNDLYSKEKELRTINRFSQLGTFKFISISHTRADRNDNYLDCYIYLTPAKKQAITGTLETNVTNEGLFGLAGSLSYKNKNLTKRADQLLFDISSGIQLRFSKERKVEVITNTASTNITYYMNKFLIPFRARLFSRNTNPRTRMNANYTFENRYDFNSNSDVTFLYQLHNFNLSYGYEWNENPMKLHLFNLVNINFFLLPKRGDVFNQRLDSNAILKSSFEEQVTIGPNYVFTFSNQRSASDRYYMYFRSNIETAGNIIYAGFKLANLKSQHDSLYLIANRPFSQFFRIEGDWRNYFRINIHSLFAIRTFAGIGVPYGNSVALPFVKQFFVGGPNSLRGFLIREIGPGSYANENYNRETGENQNSGFFNQTGDIKLEMNAEVRFDIYKWLKGAVFADAGNVWLLRKDTRLNGEFNFKRFWDEFAVDAGAGIRLDFSFFAIRFDYGFPLRDPRRLDGMKWQFDKGYAFKNGQFQLAIGYPF